MPSFKSLHTLEERKTESLRIRTKYPDRAPVIIEKYRNSTCPNLDKCKFLIPLDFTIGQLVCVIRKRMTLSPEKSLFIFVGNVLPPTSLTIIDLYENHKDEDGYLYCLVSEENTFG